MEILHGEEDGEKNKKLEKDKKTAEEMRLQSLETFSETRKRKAENTLEKFYLGVPRLSKGEVIFF